MCGITAACVSVLGPGSVNHLIAKSECRYKKKITIQDKQISGIKTNKYGAGHHAVFLCTDQKPIFLCSPHVAIFV